MKFHSYPVGLRKRTSTPHTLARTSLLGRIASNEYQRYTARADRELPDAVRLVRPAVRILLREPLVEVVVAVDDHVHLGVVQDAPDLLHVPVFAVGSRREQRLVPDGGRAAGVLCHLAAQPLRLHAHRPAAELAVDRVDAPAADRVGVVAEPARTGAVAEVVVVAGRAGVLVVVVAGCGARPSFVASPARIVTISKLCRAAAWIGVVAGREHGAGNVIEQARRSLGAC